MDARWTLSELVAEVAAQIAALPAPRNGQVRAVPDERTVRYYGTIGLLDRPAAMRGRTALYGRKHLAQVVAIKRLQAMGRALAEIQTLWPTLDAATLARMSGVAFTDDKPVAVRGEFWKRASEAPSPAQPPEPVREQTKDLKEPELIMLPAVTVSPGAPTLGVVIPASRPAPVAEHAPVELRIELAPNVVLTLAVADDNVAISPADVRALRAAAAPLVAALANRRLTAHPEGDEP